MRTPFSVVAPLALLALTGACSSSSPSSAFDPGTPGADAGSSSGGDDDASSPPTGDASTGTLGSGDAGPIDAAHDGDVTVTTTIYAHTDDSLYQVDPATKAVTLIGKFAGLGGGTGDTSVTDLAVNGNNELYVNSETVIYKVALPSSGTGNVQLTKVAVIAAKSGQKYFALAFTPKDALGAGTGEVLIGGDGAGELWSIDPSSGATKDLGGFGKDPGIAGNVLALSGDIMFYVDAAGAPTGLATIRSCTPSKSGGNPTCSGPSDYLAGVDMAALQTAYSSGTRAPSLNGGIYGGSTTSAGPGTQHRDVFGLGAWEGTVYGFARAVGSGANASPAELLAIDTSGANAGQSTVIPEQVSFTNGWSGAGVTTKVTVNVPPPPPPPK